MSDLEKRIKKIESIVKPKIQVIVGSSKEEVEEQMRKYTEEGIDFSGCVVLIAEVHDKGVNL